MGANALILGLAILALTASPLSAAPKDPCTLLKTAEIQALAPNTKIGAGVSSTIPGPDSVVCQYEWGTGNNVQSGRFSLLVQLSDASKLFPGMSSAVFTSNDPIRASTTAYAKGLILEVAFQGANARAKDQVIALLKFAVARL